MVKDDDCHNDATEWGKEGLRRKDEPLYASWGLTTTVRKTQSTKLLVLRKTPKKTQGNFTFGVASGGFNS